MTRSEKDERQYALSLVAILGVMGSLFAYGALTLIG